jgi:hypothetical protein
MSERDNDICDTDACDSDPSCSVHPLKRIRVEDPVLQWQATDFEPKIRMFGGDNSGISGTIDVNSSVFEFFNLFFPFHTMQNIADQTNRYYVLLMQKLPPTPQPRLQNWKNTTPEELYIFFAIVMLMCRVKKLTIAEYWSRDPLIATP